MTNQIIAIPGLRNPLEEIENEIYSLLKKSASLESMSKENSLKHSLEMRKLFLSIIEINDAFENIFKSLDSRADSFDGASTGIIKNFRTIQKMLLRMLKSYEVISFETVTGQKASPEKHLISEVSENPAMEDETIIEEIKKGYLWQGQLLRAAEVRVVKNK